MALSILHAKVDTVPDWTQAQLDAQIALGNYPPGTLLADIVLPSDWNNSHTLSGSIRSVNVVAVDTSAGSTSNTFYSYFVSGLTTITMPTAVGNTNSYDICRTGASTVTIATTGGQTINGSSSAALTVVNQCLTLVSDGTNWRIV